MTNIQFCFFFNREQYFVCSVKHFDWKKMSTVFLCGQAECFQMCKKICQFTIHPEQIVVRNACRSVHLASFQGIINIL